LCGSFARARRCDRIPAEITRKQERLIGARQSISAHDDRLTCCITATNVNDAHRNFSESNTSVMIDNPHTISESSRMTLHGSVGFAKSAQEVFIILHGSTRSRVRKRSVERELRDYDREAYREPGLVMPCCAKRRHQFAMRRNARFGADSPAGNGDSGHMLLHDNQSDGIEERELPSMARDPRANQTNDATRAHASESGT